MLRSKPGAILAKFWTLRLDADVLCARRRGEPSRGREGNSSEGQHGRDAPEEQGAPPPPQHGFMSGVDKLRQERCGAPNESSEKKGGAAWSGQLCGAHADRPGEADGPMDAQAWSAICSRRVRSISSGGGVLMRPTLPAVAGRRKTEEVAGAREGGGTGGAPRNLWAESAGRAWATGVLASAHAVDSTG